MKTETAKLVYGFMWLAEAHCKIKEDAEDLIQDVILRLVDKSDWFENLPVREQHNYIAKSIRNRFIDFNRRQKAARRDNKNNLLPRVSRAEAYGIIELKEVKKKASKNKNCKTLFMLAEGYSIREISLIRRVSENTVLGTNHRARKFLKA